MHEVPSSPDRRAFLRQGVRLLLLLPAAAGLAACGESAEKAPGPAPAAPPSAPPAAPPAASTLPVSPEAPAQPGALVTEIADNATLVASLQYVNQGANPEQVCEGCQLYTAVAEGKGRCTLFQQGLVAARGHCASWILRQA